MLAQIDVDTTIDKRSGDKIWQGSRNWQQPTWLTLLSHTGNINLPPVMVIACNCSYICMTEMKAPDRKTLDRIFDWKH